MRNLMAPARWEVIIGSMAASPIQPADLLVVDLREFRGDDLAALLAEQTTFWSEHFYWDFTPSREVIRRFMDARNLYGFVLLREGRPIGYSYFVHEDRKALIGDLFITAPERSEEAERFLLYNTVRSAAVFPGVRRIEGQLLSLSSSPFNPADELVYGRRLSAHERHFMLLDRPGDWPASPRKAAAFRYRKWVDGDLHRAADLIAHAYQDHVDGLINDQYRSFAGARRFLFNTTQHPGCGIFLRQAALVAIDRLSDRMCGVCLGSLVQPEVGHITQLAVAPEVRRRGVGLELLRRSIGAFGAQGCSAVSLTVTASNRSAVELYAGLGFRVCRKFSAFVWEAR